MFLVKSVNIGGLHVFRLLHLAVRSRYLYQAEKKKTVFIENGPV